MFKSKYKRKYEQLVSDIKAEIWLNNGIIEFYEKNEDKLEKRGENTPALIAVRLCRQECVDILDKILKRAEEV